MSLEKHLDNKNIRTKIVFIAPSVLPRIGGVERHIEKVSNILASLGHDVSIIAPKCGTAFERSNSGVKIYRIVPWEYRSNTRFNKLMILVGLIRAHLSLIRHIRLFADVDVIHLHDSITFLWYLPLWLFMRRSSFITFHGFEGYPISNLNKFLRKMACRITKGNICIGSFIAKWYHTEPTYTILGGVDLTNGNETKYSEKNCATFIGRLANDTGILEYVEALRILKENYNINIPLHICGDGPLRSAINSLKERHGLDVSFHGFVEEPIHFLRKSKFAFVSGYLSILEAMINRRPVFVIYTNELKKDYIYSIPDVENLLFVFSSPRALADKLYNILQANEQEEVIERAYEFAKKHAWSKVARIYLRLYGLD